MVEGFWPIFFLAVILKIPIAGLLYLVWWAVHQTPETEDAPPAARTATLASPREPRRPRGPGAGPMPPTRCRFPDCPPGGRLRVLTPPARARRVRSCSGLRRAERDRVGLAGRGRRAGAGPMRTSVASGSSAICRHVIRITVRPRATSSASRRRSASNAVRSPWNANPSTSTTSDASRHTKSTS